MAKLEVGDENGTPVELYFEDHGTGDPVVLIHAWPMSSRIWEAQVPALVDAGHRVIAYDRRGFGASSQPWEGYDWCEAGPPGVPGGLRPDVVRRGRAGGPRQRGAAWLPAPDRRVRVSEGGTLGCLESIVRTDFRADLAKVTVPTLLIHGDADVGVPLEVTAKRSHAAIAGSELVVIEGGAHGLVVTHAEEVNRALLDFLGR